MEHKDIAIFKEDQRFRQAWLWLILLGLSFFYIYILIEQIVLGRPFGNNPMDDTALIITVLLVGVGIPWLMYVCRLETEVRYNGLFIRFYPFQWSFREIDLSDIETVEARTYNPIMEYGGWGIRYSRKGVAYNVTGNKGVQLVFKYKRNILIGSQRADELANAIKAMLDKTK